MSPSLSEACSSWNPPAILVRLLPVALGGLFIGGCAVDITDPGAAGTDFGNDDQVTDEAGDSGGAVLVQERAALQVQGRSLGGLGKIPGAHPNTTPHPCPIHPALPKPQRYDQMLAFYTVCHHI